MSLLGAQGGSQTTSIHARLEKSYCPVAAIRYHLVFLLLLPLPFFFWKKGCFHLPWFIPLKKGFQGGMDNTFPGEHRALWHITLKGSRGTMHDLVTLFTDTMSCNETLGSCQSQMGMRSSPNQASLRWHWVLHCVLTGHSTSLNCGSNSFTKFAFDQIKQEFFSRNNPRIL